MTCQNYKDLMMGFLDEELDSEQTEQFLAHIKQCPNCVEILIASPDCRGTAAIA